MPAVHSHPHHQPEAMSSVEKNLGFIYNSRLLDLMLTLACAAIAGLGFMINDDKMVAFAVPAGIGLFRQAMPLLTFPYVLTIFFATVVTASSLEIFERFSFWG